MKYRQLGQRYLQPSLCNRDPQSGQWSHQASEDLSCPSSHEDLEEASLEERLVTEGRFCGLVITWRGILEGAGERWEGARPFQERAARRRASLSASACGHRLTRSRCDVSPRSTRRASRSRRRRAARCHTGGRSCKTSWTERTAASPWAGRTFTSAGRRPSWKRAHAHASRSAGTQAQKK